MYLLISFYFRSDRSWFAKHPRACAHTFNQTTAKAKKASPQTLLKRSYNLEPSDRRAEHAPPLHATETPDSGQTILFKQIDLGCFSLARSLLPLVAKQEWNVESNPPRQQGPADRAKCRWSADLKFDQTSHIKNLKDNSLKIPLLCVAICAASTMNNNEYMFINSRPILLISGRIGSVSVVRSPPGSAASGKKRGIGCGQEGAPKRARRYWEYQRELNYINHSNRAWSTTQWCQDWTGIPAQWQKMAQLDQGERSYM